MDTKGKKKNTLAQLMDYKAELKRHEEDFDKVLQILKRMSEMTVSSQDLSKSEIGRTLSHLKTVKDKKVQEQAKDLIDKWKKLIQKAKMPSSFSPIATSDNSPSSSPQDTTSSSDKSLPAFRRNVKKMLLEALTDGFAYEEQSKTQDISNAIELAMYEVLREGSKYINRGKAIVSNITDEKNQEFKRNILGGSITPHQLATMDVKDMMNTTQKNERAQTEKNMFESLRSDWQDEHVQVADGLHTCENCKSKKTTSKEIQMRGADEPMTLFIKCVECGNEWKLN